MQASGLRKSYGETVALDGVDLHVDAGTIFALLGPNGAGKTTAVQILSTLVHADAGEVRVAGHDPARDPAAVRRAIGVTGQFSAVDGLLTGEENLALMADLHHRCASGRPKADRRAARPVRPDGGGPHAGRHLFRRDASAARPRDDPDRRAAHHLPRRADHGLDPGSRRTVWQIVRDLVAGGVTIFLTTHYLEEADELADRAAVLHRGKVIAEGSPDELKRLIPGGFVGLEFADADALGQAARSFPDATRDDDDLTLQIPSDASAGAIRDLLDRLGGASAAVERVSVHTPDLDEVFLALTGDAEEERGALR